MNPITHAYLALELFREEKLTQDEKDHLIVGSILPDINQSGLIHYHKTHHKALDFLKDAEHPLHQYLGIGMVLHGENPKGVDYFAHLEKGFISRNRKGVNGIAREYQKSIGKINVMTAHYLIEFSADSIIARKDPKIIPQIFSAFKNPKIKEAITAFSTHFGLSERKNYKIIRLLQNRHLLHFFENFSSVETVARSWINFTFFLNLKKGRSLSFREKVKALTKFSYYNLKRKLHHQKVTRLFEEINESMEQPVLKFVYHTIEKLRPLKNELKKNLG